MDAPLDVRVARIKNRPHDVKEHRARKVDRSDLEVFAARERIMRQLMDAEPVRFLTIDNNRPLTEGVSQVLGLVHAWRSGVS